VESRGVRREQELCRGGKERRIPEQMRKERVKKCRVEE
jgi:hypothetical protein